MWVTDGGFTGFPNILYSALTNKSEGLNELPEYLQRHYSMLSRVEKDIERVFSDGLYKKYGLCRSIDSRDVERLEHSQTMVAAMTLHNIEVATDAPHILQGPCKQIARYLFPDLY